MIINLNKRLVVGIMSVAVSVLVILLIWEYTSLRAQTDKILELQEEYYGYVDMMKKSLRKKKVDSDSIGDDEIESSGDSDDNDDLEVDSFIVINRAPSHLKQSTVAYIKEQRLDSLLNKMNLSEWQNYTDHVIERDTKKPQKKRGSKSKRKSAQPSRRSAAQWLPARRDSITGLEFKWPIERSKFWLSSPFGPRKKPNGSWGFHYGIDMAAPRGTLVRSAAGGVVEFAGPARGYGNTVVISHDGVYKTRYAHLDAIYVRQMRRVQAGDRVGAVGDTGFTIKSGKDASHLHFELYEQGKQINPLHLLPR